MDVAQRLSGQIVRLATLRGVDHFKTFEGIDWFEEGSSKFAELERELTDLLRTNGPGQVTSNGSMSPPHSTMIDQTYQAIIAHAKQVNAILLTTKPAIGGERRVYVPILRDLRRPNGSDRANHVDLYQARTRSDYALTEERCSVFTGLSLFDDVRNLLLGTREERARATAYENFLSKELFEEKEVELIPHKTGDVVHLRIGDDERPIHDLGDGMQSLITITFPAFVAAERTLFFIEEPETHLHPGMQRKLLELLLRHSQLNRHQYFATTHSNHLLDMAADYSGCTTYLIRKEATGERPFRIRTLDNADRQAMRELGVRSSSVFLTNATIWVEGISDRLYIREYFRRFLSDSGRNELREDTHYSFMECGGANVAHFDFTSSSPAVELAGQIRTSRLCTNSFLILDGDNAKKPRLKPLIEQLGDDLFLLAVKEIENTLPLEILVAYAKSKTNAQLPLQNLTLAKYHKKRTALGKVMDRALGTNLFTDGQTIRNKGALCAFATAYMRNEPRSEWGLTGEARTMCERLLTFIDQANRN